MQIKHVLIDSPCPFQFQHEGDVPQAGGLFEASNEMLHAADGNLEPLEIKVLVMMPDGTALQPIKTVPVLWDQHVDSRRGF